MLCRIRELLIQHDIDIKAEYINTKANVLADSLSRGDLGTYYRAWDSHSRQAEDYLENASLQLKIYSGLHTNTAFKRSQLH